MTEEDQDHSKEKVDEEKPPELDYIQKKQLELKQRQYELMKNGKIDYSDTNSAFTYNIKSTPISSKSSNRHPQVN